MKKDKKEGQDRAWFLEKNLQEMESYHNEELKEEHKEWTRKAHDLETMEKEKVKDYSKQIMKGRDGPDERLKREKKIGGVRGKPHTEKKMDRKGRTEKS
ncbi:MAG: hypothetical protein IME96_10525 [Proteobacteria bacterium]|nr:hypothetical protein [Pseudomonadota bacterium]